MQESLAGRPTAEIITAIVHEDPFVQKFYLGGFKHIPMIDFDFKTNPSISVDTVRTTLNDLCFPNGYILTSGGGFHYIGSRLIPEWGFNRALKELRKLKRDSGVDRRWLELAEDEGFFTLRLTSGTKKPQVPTVTALHFLTGRPTNVGTPWNTCATRYGAAIDECNLFDQWEFLSE